MWKNPNQTHRNLNSKLDPDQNQTQTQKTNKNLNSLARVMARSQWLALESQWVCVGRGWAESRTNGEGTGDQPRFELDSEGTTVGCGWG